LDRKHNGDCFTTISIRYCTPVSPKDTFPTLQSFGTPPLYATQVILSENNLEAVFVIITIISKVEDKPEVSIPKAEIRIIIDHLLQIYEIIREETALTIFQSGYDMSSLI
jgi:hypothetical protein